MEWLEAVMKRFKELVELPGEIGDTVAFVLNDAVVTVELDLNESGERTIKINTIAGEPERMDITTGIAQDVTTSGVRFARYRYIPTEQPERRDAGATIRTDGSHDHHKRSFGPARGGQRRPAPDGQATRNRH